MSTVKEVLATIRSLQDYYQDGVELADFHYKEGKLTLKYHGKVNSLEGSATVDGYEQRSREIFDQGLNLL